MTDPFGSRDRAIGIEHVDHDQALIGLSFDDQFRAQEFLTAMTRLASVGALVLRDAVVVSKDPNGEVKVRETIDPQPGRSAISGAAWTGLLGLLVGGPVGWIAGLGIGAGAGAITAKVVDLGVPDEWVDWFRQAVRDGTTTVVILAENVDIRALEAEARRFAGAELVHSTLPASAIDQIRTALEGTDRSARPAPLSEPEPEPEPESESESADASWASPAAEDRADDVAEPGEGPSDEAR